MSRAHRGRKAGVMLGCFMGEGEFLGGKGAAGCLGQGQAQVVDGEGVYCLPALCLRFAPVFTLAV